MLGNISLETHPQDDLHIQPDLQTINRNVWPREIQVLIQELRPLLFGTVLNEDLASTLIPSSRHSYTCLTFIDSCLHALEMKPNQLQTTLEEEKHYLTNYNRRLEKQVHDFIEQELLAAKIEIDCQTELIYYDYKNEINQRELNRELILDEQVDIYTSYFYY